MLPVWTFSPCRNVSIAARAVKFAIEHLGENIAIAVRGARCIFIASGLANGPTERAMHAQADAITTAHARDAHPDHVHLTVRARFWHGQGITEEAVYVDITDGIVRVWDDIAGHYTTFHSLSKSAIARIRKMARVAREGS